MPTDNVLHSLQCLTLLTILDDAGTGTSQKSLNLFPLQSVCEIRQVRVKPRATAVNVTLSAYAAAALLLLGDRCTPQMWLIDETDRHQITTQTLLCMQTVPKTMPIFSSGQCFETVK